MQWGGRMRDSKRSWIPGGKSDWDPCRDDYHRTQPRLQRKVFWNLPLHCFDCLHRTTQQMSVLLFSWKMADQVCVPLIMRAHGERKKNPLRFFSIATGCVYYSLTRAPHEEYGFSKEKRLLRFGGPTERPRQLVGYGIIVTMLMTVVTITLMLVRQTRKHVFPPFHFEHKIMLKAVQLKWEGSV